MNWLVKKVLSKIALYKSLRIRQQFRSMARRAPDVQRQHLMRQIRREQDTGFGRDHHFRSIRSVADFRKQLPITRYEYYQPYIERVKNGEIEAMFHRQQVMMFAMTSGTTASRKYIPVTRRFLDDYRRGWQLWGLHMFEHNRHLWFKPMLQIASDWDEFRTPAGIPCGSISGLTAQMQMKLVRKHYLLPPSSSKIKDTHSKYYLAWRLGLVRGVSVMISANPSTMVNLARFAEGHIERLIRDVRDGGISSDFPMPEQVLFDERHRLEPNPTRAKELEQIVSATGGLRPKDVWPGLGMIGNWTGGSVGAYLRHYPEYYGTPPVRDIGLIASEGRMTIPIEDNTSSGILEITSSYFEFIPVEEIDSPQPTVLESHELEVGRDYYILLTTASGLYRYNIFDVVRCTGWFEKAPLLAFLNKGSNFSNLTGEKLSEHQVAQSVVKSLSECDLRLAAYSMAPCWEEHTPFYGLFVEQSDFPSAEAAQQFVCAVERHLHQENVEYEAKRESHRLLPVRLMLMPRGTWKAWDRERLQRTGGTSEQYKHPCLIVDGEFAAKMPVEQQIPALDLASTR